MYKENLPVQENILVKINRTMNELRNDAIQGWNKMDGGDIAKALVSGEVLVATGILISAFGQFAGMPSIDILGKTFAVLGVGLVITGFLKTGELALIEHVTNRWESRNRSIN